ncbi:LysE family translocator [Pseudolysinimonas kribbensis]|jgi:threonine/homoserine/homoserine lactone efflux protein|uniref:Lysine transporter LysE n=1 Tax=Pseudolysinimonas kribbensis TaxID=433641 RepID=A0ABQ6K5V1_9MICO|nr:LysE family translocator [Pseudolysinimonas kribbensis]GMA95116.1 lysine transporter LysE [Pseudolysinimonas kribbensis]
MPPLASILGFLGAALIIFVIPGPSVLFVVGRSLALGTRGGLLSDVGNALGIVPQVLAVAFGIGFLVQQSVVLLTVIKIAGGLYLVYLGIQAIRHRNARITDDETPVAWSPWRLIGQGFLVGITNPKAIVLYSAVLPQFLDPRQAAIPQLLILGGMGVVLGFLSDSVWVIIAGTARQWFARSPHRIARTSLVGGVLMIGLGGTLAVSGVPGIRV